MDSRSTYLHIDKNKLLIFSENENKFCRNEKNWEICGRVGGSEIVSFDELHSLRWGELVGVEGAVGRNLHILLSFNEVVVVVVHRKYVVKAFVFVE